MEELHHQIKIILLIVTTGYFQGIIVESVCLRFYGLIVDSECLKRGPFLVPALPDVDGVPSQAILPSPYEGIVVAPHLGVLGEDVRGQTRQETGDLMAND